MQAVERRVEQGRRREVGQVVGQPDELSVAVLEALDQQRPQRQADHQQQDGGQHDHPGAHQQIVARQPDAQGGGGEAHAANTLTRSGGSATSSFLPRSTPRSRIRLLEKSPTSVTSPARRVARQKAPTKSSSATSTDRRFGVSAERSRTRTSSGRMHSRTLLAATRPSCGGQANDSPPTFTRSGAANVPSREFIPPTTSATNA